MGSGKIRCANCGGPVNLESGHSKATCDYCGFVTAIADASKSPDTPPGLRIVAPKLDQAAALAAYRTWASQAKFAPGSFRKNPPQPSVANGLVPFYAMGFEARSDWRGDREKNDVVQAYSGVRTVEHWRVTIGARQLTPLEVSQLQIPDELSNAPQTDPPSGWSLVKIAFDEDLAGRVLRDEIRALERTACEMEAIKQDVPKLSSCATSVTPLRSAKVFYVPCWLLTFKHKGKEHRVVVRADNGQVAGTPPVSRMKAVLAIGAGLIVAVVLLIALCSGSEDGPGKQATVAPGSGSGPAVTVKDAKTGVVVRLMVLPTKADDSPWDVEGPPDPEGEITIDGSAEVLPKAQDSFRAEHDLAMWIGTNSHVTITLKDADVLSPDPIGQATGVFDGTAPLWLDGGQFVGQVMTRSQAKDHPAGKFEAEGASRIVDKKAKAAEEAFARGDWNECLAADAWLRVFEDGGGVPKGNKRIAAVKKIAKQAWEKVREARLEKWKATLVKKGAKIAFQGVDVSVRSGKVIRECVNPKPIAALGRVVSPDAGGYFASVEISEKNTTREYGSGASNNDGFSTLDYKLVDVSGQEHAKSGAIADCVTKTMSFDERGPYTRLFYDVDPGQTWKFREFFEVGPGVDKKDLYVEIRGPGPDGKEQVARVRLF